MRRAQQLRGLLQRSRVRNHGEPLDTGFVDDLVECRLPGQEIAEALVELHAQIGRDLRTLHVEVHEEHPGVHIPGQRNREVDRRQRLAVAGSRRRDRDGMPGGSIHALLHARTENLVRAFGARINDLPLHAMTFHRRGINRRCTKGTRRRSGRRHTHAVPLRGARARRLGRSVFLGASSGCKLLDLEYGGFDDAHGNSLRVN